MTNMILGTILSVLLGGIFFILMCGRIDKRDFVGMFVMILFMLPFLGVGIYSGVDFFLNYHGVWRICGIIYFSVMHGCSLFLGGSLLHLSIFNW